LSLIKDGNPRDERQIQALAIQPDERRGDTFTENIVAGQLSFSSSQH
jgi:hypothetical protein